MRNVIKTSIQGMPSGNVRDIIRDEKREWGVVCGDFGD